MPEQHVCGGCGQPLKSHESISVANVGLRCYRCFNEETAPMMGVLGLSHQRVHQLAHGKQTRG